MAYEIELHEEDIVIIRFHGPSDLAESQKGREEVLQVCRDARITLILADWRAAATDQTVSTIDLYGFGETWPPAEPSVRYRLATVLSRDAKTRRDIQFADTVAVNRGVKSKVFDETEEAIAWLRSEKRLD